MSFYRSSAPVTTLTPTALVITSHLLRHDNPTLASAIQRALDELKPVATEGEIARLAEPQLNAALLHNLQAQTVGEILAALTAIGQRALADRQHQPERIALLHQLLDDWVALAEWILQRNNAAPDQWH